MNYIKISFLAAYLLMCTAISAQKKQINIACVGNSITYGATVKDREKNSYPAQLQAMLGDGYSVTNFGVSARTLLRNGNYPYWTEEAFHNALNSKPDVVFILLGTNDSKGMNRPFYNEFEKDYSDLIDSFRNLSSHPRVIMLLPTAVFTNDANSIYDSVVVNNIIPMSREVAYNKKCEVLDLHPLFLGKEHLLSDGVHPGAEGQTLIAERLYEQLQLNESKVNLFSKIKNPLTNSDFYGFDCADFKFENRDCKIVKPRTAGKGMPWIWRARFWGHEPQTDIALLERGFYLVYCDVAELYGNKQAISIWDGFYKRMRSLGLNKKAAMEGMSRGGAYVYNWAAANPSKVACVYADAPVLDFKSWPGGKG
ncbi:MAG: GDSL-type esterase/lipase family protein, partial [Ginsengibacter sp.]